MYRHTQRGRVWMVAALLATLAGLNTVPPAAAGTRAEPEDLPPTGTAPVDGAVTLSEGAVSGPDADWWSAAQDEIGRSEYQVTWQEQTYLADVPAAYQAPNRAENLRTYFLPDGPIVIPRQGIEPGGPLPWRWEARLVAWGREGAMSAPGEARLDARENRIAYLRGGSVLERYRNDAEGLEQSFTLLDAPPGGQPLRLEVALGGDLLPQVAGEGAAISFSTAGGTDALRYGGLHASDAAGEALPAWLSVDGPGLSIWIDDAGASYPIEVKATLRGLPPESGWSITFAQEGARFGYSLATAGDVDGDGYSDVIVGVPYFDAGLEDEGGALLYHGWRDGLFTVADWVQTGGQAGARYGWSVATAGDVNGDGFADVIIGAPYYSAGQSEEGRVWIYHGAPNGLSSTAARHKESNIASAHFGDSVATAGDVNNDGYADVIIGARDYGVSHAAEGRVYVWHGGPDGIPTGDAHWTAESNQNGGRLGSCVATAGDVNGDGFADVVVGAELYDDTRTDEGAVFVWHGSAAGANGGVAGVPTNAAWQFFSGQAGARLGNAVSTAGDVNGDGYADVIVGAQLYDHSLVDEGGAWLFLGSTAGLAGEWHNFDYGNQAGAWFGYSVATAGDVNGDGYADVIVGAPLFTTSVLEEGKAWVWHGSAAGISATRDWTADGEMPQAWYGASVATAGDVNGDGYSEVIIGAYGHAAMAGRAYAYYGGPGTLRQTAGWTKRSNQMEAYFGTSVGTAGDVNGDGYADVIVGAPRWDGGQENEGAAWVYLGQATGLAIYPALLQEERQRRSRVWPLGGHRRRRQRGWVRRHHRRRTPVAHARDGRGSGFCLRRFRRGPRPGSAAAVEQGQQPSRSPVRNGGGHGGRRERRWLCRHRRRRALLAKRGREQGCSLALLRLGRWPAYRAGLVHGRQPQGCRIWLCRGHCRGCQRRWLQRRDCRLALLARRRHRRGQGLGLPGLKWRPALRPPLARRVQQLCGAHGPCSGHSR
jgi:hypothetical protein